MTEEREEKQPNHLVILIILAISVILFFLLIVYTPTFDQSCDKLYGKDNWSEYKADDISLIPNSSHPVYLNLNNHHAFTCFKTGTIP